MRAPPFFVAAALVFWGSQAGLAVPALALALGLEASRIFPGRWDLAREHQHRLSDLCAAVFAAVAVYSYAVRDSSAAAGLMLQWAPLFFAPLLAAQAWSEAGTVDAGAFFWTLRDAQGEAQRWPVDVSYPYAAVCLLAAGGANTRSEAFYPAAFALTAWGLLSVRPRTAPTGVFLALLLAAGAAGHAGHKGLRALQPIVEAGAINLAYGVLKAGQKSPFESRTAIGTLGALKRSDRIVMRLRGDGLRRPPALWRNAGYDLYKGRDWLAGGVRFTDLPAGPEDGSWELAPPAPRAASFSVNAAFPEGQGLLALPGGAFRVEGLPAEALRRGRLGAVLVVNGPSSADVVVRAGDAPGGEAAPDASDLSLPEPLRGTLTDLARRLRLDGRRPREAMAAAARYFAEGFRYSLYQADRDTAADPLADFLLRTRAGHCEHFATATVLLLRAGGVPARYATGFSVSEFSRLEGAWVVRQRHAHAWARVFVDGAWSDLDTTPASWSEAEDAQASLFQPLGDLASWLKLSSLRALRGNGGDAVRRRAAWVLGPLLLWLAWRLRGGLGTLARAGAAPAPAPALPGLDSELYAVEAALAARGLGRRGPETFASWARRVSPPGGALPDLARLHERHRFDPAGLSPAEREALRAGAAAMLADFGKT